MIRGIRSCLLLALTLMATAAVGTVHAWDKVRFKADDGLTVTADLYRSNNRNAPLIILFHRAGWSRGEYRPVAPRLVEMGYHCLAVNQRSGGSVLGIVNETAAKAVALGRAVDFLAAYQDMEAALRYVREKFPESKVILWGSSYSASLALVLAAHHQDEVAAVLAFSPGEYFAKFGKSPTLVQDGVKGLRMPVFVTSARSEEGRWKAIFDAIPSGDKVSFIPSAKGAHGTQALWPETPGSREYWKAVRRFLEMYAPTARGAAQPSSAMSSRLLQILNSADLRPWACFLVRPLVASLWTSNPTLSMSSL